MSPVACGFSDLIMVQSSRDLLNRQLCRLVITPIAQYRWGERELKDRNQPPCPACPSERVIKNGHKDGRQRWLCRDCGHTFGPTYGTLMYHLRTPPKEVVRTLLVAMRQRSLRSSEKAAGHQYETIGQWLSRAAEDKEAITHVLVRDFKLTTAEVGDFWSLVEKRLLALQQRRAR